MDWLFLKLEGRTLSIDLTVYPIAQCDRILGILASMVSQAGRRVGALPAAEVFSTMPYSSFTLGKVSRTFHLETVRRQGIFAGIEPVEPSAHLTATLERNLRLL